MYIPDSKQSLGQCWVMVVVVGNTSLFACWHLPNISPILACWPKGVGPRSSGQQIPTMVQRIIAIWDIPVRVIWEGLQWSILNVFFFTINVFLLLIFVNSCWSIISETETLTSSSQRYLRDHKFTNAEAMHKDTSGSNWCFKWHEFILQFSKTYMYLNLILIAISCFGTIKSSLNAIKKVIMTWRDS